MTLGQVIATICEYSSDWEEPTLYMMDSIYSIEVVDDGVLLRFVDANKRDLLIRKIYEEEVDI